MLPQVKQAAKVSLVLLLSALCIFYFVRIVQYRNAAAALEEETANILSTVNARLQAYEDSILFQGASVQSAYSLIAEAAERLERLGDTILERISETASAPATIITDNPRPESTASPTELATRAERSRATLREYFQRAENVQLFELYTDGRGINSWSPQRFIQDPAINPDQIELSEYEQLYFGFLFNKSLSSIKQLEMEKEVLIQDGFARKVEGLLNGDPPEPLDGRSIADLISGDTILRLSENEVPEVPVLKTEMSVAILDWFEIARTFFRED